MEGRRMNKRSGNKWDNTIFVKWIEPPNSDVPYREVHGDAEDAAEIGETVVVGEYKFLRTRRVKLNPEVS
jgi:hypothetical protein